MKINSHVAILKLDQTVMYSRCEALLYLLNILDTAN